MLQNIWDFFQNEVLGMNWLNLLLENLLNACGLDTSDWSNLFIPYFVTHG